MFHDEVRLMCLPRTTPWRAGRPMAAALLTLALTALPAQAQRGGASELSALSALPVAVSVALPAGLLVAGASFTVVAVESLSDATVWVLERASDGARFSLRLAGEASAVVGTGVVVSAVAAGWVLSAAGEALCFVPNERGRSLMHDERITR